MNKKPFDKLVQVVAKLRSDDGCPWDRQQTHSTLKANLIEEAYEVIEAIDAEDNAKLQEELGDLLMQVMLHAQISKYNGNFSINDVIKTITDKLIRRHPHVFSDLQVENAKEVLANWEAIKRNELGYEGRKSILDGIPMQLPSLYRAQKIQNKASRVGFDWDEAPQVLPKIEEEIGELKDSIKSADKEEMEMEIGDLLFSIVNLSRLLVIDAEDALRKSNRKFTERFKKMEAELEKRGDKFEDYNLEKLDEVWEQIKREESKGQRG